MNRSLRPLVVVLVAISLLAAESAFAARGIIVKKPIGSNGRFSGEILDDKSGEVVKFIDQRIDSGRYLLPIDINDGVEYEYDAGKGTAYNITKITEVELTYQGVLGPSFGEALFDLVRSLNSAEGPISITVLKIADVVPKGSLGMILDISKGTSAQSGTLLDIDTGKEVIFNNQKINRGGYQFPAGVYDGVSFDYEPTTGTPTNFVKVVETIFIDSGPRTGLSHVTAVRIVPNIMQGEAPLTLKLSAYRLER